MALRDAAVSVVQRLREAGFRALLAGGCVRDLLMGKAATDYDVATDARPDEIVKLFRKTRSVGRAFGVILVSAGRHWIEVATFRSDVSYSDGRHPDAIRFSSPEEDAQRRDFTINGMFYDPLEDRLIDFIGGRTDLEAGLVRAIGDPEARFAEDHLRLLRAIRFAARLGFRIEDATWEALRRQASSLRKVSPERVHDELEAMLTHATRRQAWRFLNESQLVCFLWKGSERLCGRADAISAILHGLPPAPISFALALAVLALPSMADAEEMCDALRASNELRNGVTWLVAHHRDLDEPGRVSLADLKRLMSGPAFADLMLLLRARLAAAGAGAEVYDEIERRVAAIRPEDVAPPPFVTGDDLMAFGLPPGPIYREILDKVYYAQQNGDISDREAGLAMARSLAAAGR